MVLVLLIPIIGFATANPFQDTLDDRLALQVQKMLLQPPTESPGKADKMVENLNKTLSSLKRATSRLKDSETRDNEANEKLVTQGGTRKHKALLLDYPLVSRVSSHYPRIPSPFEVDYNDDSEVARQDRLSKEFQKRYQESNIFYIRLPPTPYTFVPGFGYISQPPTYSTAALKPQLPLVTQLLQLPYVRPATRPQPTSQQTLNPFIKVPVDFVSNGKPTSVYQWQKKPNQRPADSPITNLDTLSADFVTNGKPTSIYRWPANHKLPKRPDDALNSLDMDPYTFNGKLTSLYLLGPDGSTSMHQSIRYPDYQDGYY
ncbi:uncharacterized protein LOC114937598 [Nylanderia fulva]|uniref:uncharacterized protein LOC114937598 n=1 Tax=Nylanderia fulva TaxID=613905 RepID=UPI0010FAF0F5|nr:uncharacterized protein LOC114937598 [Nylanderia fulva]